MNVKKSDKYSEIGNQIINYSADCQKQMNNQIKMTVYVIAEPDTRSFTSKKPDTGADRDLTRQNTL
jgi:hypothetical protein